MCCLPPCLPSMLAGRGTEPQGIAVGVMGPPPGGRLGLPAKQNDLSHSATPTYALNQNAASPHP